MVDVPYVPLAAAPPSITLVGYVLGQLFGQHGGFSNASLASVYEDFRQARDVPGLLDKPASLPLVVPGPPFTPAFSIGFFLGIHLLLGICTAALYLKRRFFTGLLNNVSLVSWGATYAKRMLLVQWLMLAYYLVYHCSFVANYGFEGNPLLTGASLQDWKSTPNAFFSTIRTMQTSSTLLHEFYLLYGVQYLVLKLENLYVSQFRLVNYVYPMLSDPTSFTDFASVLYCCLYYQNGDSLVIASIMAWNVLAALYLRSGETGAAGRPGAAMSKSLVKSLGSTVMDMHMFSCWIHHSPSFPRMRYLLFFVWFAIMLASSLVIMGMSITWYLVSAGVIIPSTLVRRSTATGLNRSQGEVNVNNLESMATPFGPGESSEAGLKGNKAAAEFDMDSLGEALGSTTKPVATEHTLRQRRVASENLDSATSAKLPPSERTFKFIRRVDSRTFLVTEAAESILQDSLKASLSRADDDGLREFLARKAAADSVNATANTTSSSTSASTSTSSAADKTAGSGTNESTSYENCSVCRNEPRSIILLPCRCLCMCDDCRRQMAAYGYDKCPTCNQNASSYLKINRP